MTSRRRPYPCVEPAAGGYRAIWPRKNGVKVDLGVYDTAAQARAAVLRTQAEHHELKAQEYRRQADALEEI